MVSSGGNEFTVDPGALRELARDLVVLSARFNEARAITQEISASEFGSAELAASVGRFVEHWKWQNDQLSQTLSDTGGRLVQAAAQYQQVEDAQNSAQGT